MRVVVRGRGEGRGRGRGRKMGRLMKMYAQKFSSEKDIDVIPSVSLLSYRKHSRELNKGITKNVI